jgi:hypothetical protein
MNSASNNLLRVQTTGIDHIHLNVNVIEDETAKIMKESNGQGARLETRLIPMDDKMIQFNNELNKMLI